MFTDAIAAHAVRFHAGELTVSEYLFLIEEQCNTACPAPSATEVAP